MVSARVCFTLAIAAVAIGCQRLSPEEEKVVGTWEFTGLDFTNRVVFHRNHRSEELYAREDSLLAKISFWAAMSRGTWKLEGDAIVTDEQVIVGPQPRERRVTRIKILEFLPDKLVREGNPDAFHRVK